MPKYTIKNQGKFVNNCTGIVENTSLHVQCSSVVCQSAGIVHKFNIARQMNERYCDKKNTAFRFTYKEVVNGFPGQLLCEISTE